VSKNYRDDLIQYRLGRAQETYDEAVLMKHEKHWNTCANRLYYSCFYAVLALLEKHGFASSKHTGVKSFFNQHFVKTGKISKDKENFTTIYLMLDKKDTISILYISMRRLWSRGSQESRILSQPLQTLSMNNSEYPL